MEYLVLFQHDRLDYKHPDHNQSNIIYAGNNIQKLITTVYEFMSNHLDYFHVYYEDDDNDAQDDPFDDMMNMMNLIETYKDFLDINQLQIDICQFEEFMNNYYEYDEASGQVDIFKWNAQKETLEKIENVNRQKK